MRYAHQERVTRRSFQGILNALRRFSVDVTVKDKEEWGRMTIRVVIVEDDSILVREGILRVLERERDIDVVAACPNSVDALAAVQATQPHVVLTGIRIPARHRDD